MLYQETQPSGGLGQARRQSVQEVKSKSWLAKGILFVLQEIRLAGASRERGPRHKEFGSEGCCKRMSET